MAQAEGPAGRTRQERRRNDYLAARRKQRVTEQVYWDKAGPPYYDNLHQYSKNKIHCSCPMCAAKTTPAWGGRNWNASDRRKMDGVTDQLRESMSS